MEYTLNGAAKATGKGKSTLHRAIKSGKLSARRTDEGSYLIDAAELARVFPVEQAGPSPWDNAGRNDTPQEQPETAGLSCKCGSRCWKLNSCASGTLSRIFASDWTVLRSGF